VAAVSGRPHPAEALGLIAGFCVWAAAFTVLYAFHGAACALGAAAARPGLVALLLAHLVAHAALAAWFLRRLRAAGPGLRFVRAASFALAVAAGVATLWTGLPAAVLRTCV
jgi:hypothetical protein